jgi:predicted kinase
MKQKIVPTVYVAVGVPSSGKSYWWETAVTNKRIPLNKSKRIHIDIIRSELCGDVLDHSKDSLVDKVALANLKNFLSYQIPLIYYDDLNIDRDIRLEINKISKEYSYKTMAIIFDTDFNECKKRLKESPKKIPIELFERYCKILQTNPVDYDEGWDDIVVVK